jgi:xanthine/CO dehydrogenase XdhC/CoxF family maturation factor
VSSTAKSLFAYFRERAATGEPLVLATVVATEGSTYRKPGAQMLIGADGSSMGLLSGGCLESDLIERAKRILATSTAEIVTYDARTSDDPVWGLGLGCEGAMHILLRRLDAAGGYQPFAFIADHTARHEPGATALIVQSDDRRFALGHAWHSELSDPTAPASEIIELCRKRAGTGGFETVTLSVADAAITVFVAALELPARLLVLGAGPDATPVVEIASLLGWQVTVGDHRSAYLEARRFPEGVRLVELRPERLATELDLGKLDAAVVMSHNLESDGKYLHALAASRVPYVGLLGPAARRQRLIAELGDDAHRLGDRLYGPVGLDIGARTPEAIGVAIVAEIQAFLSGRAGESFRIGARA